GQQSRCFCDVQDCVQAILRLVDSGRAIGEVVNIGSDQEVTIEALAQLVKQRTASCSPITHVPYDEAYEPGFEDMLRRVPSLEKLQEIAGGCPKTRLDTIVDRVVAYFRAKREGTAVEAEQLVPLLVRATEAGGTVAL
ncbi:MAG: hypothetical protein ACRD37_08415, partial [Candidatus Acidiferrales bacterium]